MLMMMPTIGEVMISLVTILPVLAWTMKDMLLMLLLGQVWMSDHIHNFINFKIFNNFIYANDKHNFTSCFIMSLLGQVWMWGHMVLCLFPLLIYLKSIVVNLLKHTDILKQSLIKGSFVWNIRWVQQVLLISLVAVKKILHNIARWYYVYTHTN